MANIPPGKAGVVNMSIRAQIELRNIEHASSPVTSAGLIESTTYEPLSIIKLMAYGMMSRVNGTPR
jgi:hypothetical protein